MRFDLLNNSLSLRALYLLAMGRGYLRYRDPYRIKAWKHREAFYENAWREAADRLGATFRSLGSGVMEMTLNGIKTRVSDNSSEIDDALTLEVLADKLLTHRILRDAKLPIPRHREFSLKRIEVATAFLERTQRRGGEKACVVKPARGSGGGRGITAGLRSRSHLARAAAAAAIYSDKLIIEEQVSGDNYRLLYLDGELLDAFVRRPPTVIGDGRSTIRNLVAKANAERIRQKSARSQVLLTIDLDMRRTLASQNHSLRAVAPAGAEVVLKTVVNENCGDDNATATPVLSPSIIDAGARAVQAVGVRLGGVDVITRDPSMPLEETGGVILEVNAPPNFYYHYHKKDGVFPVALHVLRRLLVESVKPDLRAIGA